MRFASAKMPGSKRAVFAENKSWRQQASILFFRHSKTLVFHKKIFLEILKKTMPYLEAG